MSLTLVRRLADRVRSSSILHSQHCACAALGTHCGTSPAWMLAALPCVRHGRLRSAPMSMHDGRWSSITLGCATHARMSIILWYRSAADVNTSVPRASNNPVSIAPPWCRTGASATPAHSPDVGCSRVCRRASSWGQGISCSGLGSARSGDQGAPCGLIVSARRRDVRGVGVRPSRSAAPPAPAMHPSARCRACMRVARTRARQRGG